MNFFCALVDNIEGAGASSRVCLCDANEWIGGKLEFYGEQEAIFPSFVVVIGQNREIPM